MRSYRKTVVIAVVIGVIAAAITYATAPSVPETCKAFREQMKQMVISDSTLAGVIVNAPESTLDEESQRRYAGMTAEQCTAATPALTEDLKAMSRTAWAPKMQQAGEEAATAVAQCREKRVSGELKTHVESAQCSNKEITAAFTRIGYPYADILKELTDRRVTEAEKVDKSLVAGTEDQAEFAKLAFDLAEQERKKLGGNTH